MTREDDVEITRREFCGRAAAAGLALTHPAFFVVGGEAAPKRKGDWPTPRQNRQLTSIQPLPGKIASPPKVVASIPFGTGQGALTGIASKLEGAVDRAISIASGKVSCFDLDGKLLWESHPRGLNFEQVVTAEDLDGDGRVELALTAGRPTSPLGAAVLLAADTGEVLFRYDVEPMSYWWTMQVDHYLPDGIGKQIIVCEHGYPPDEKNGYIVLFAYDKPGGKPRQRWRYDFDQYTCFPSLLTADINQDGVNELCVETHSRMWVMDIRSGEVLQFIQWDVSPANVRSYGLIRFQDLNSDGYPDFFCIANFAQHHEVLLNDKGTLKRAWAHGWDSSVTTGKIATTWPDVPIVDFDADKRLEMVLSMFNSEKEPRWMIRVYDVVTGTLKATALDRVAFQTIDIDGDGAAEILAHISTDPTLTAIQGACLLKWTGAEWKELWRQEGARIVPPPVWAAQKGGQRQRGGGRAGLASPHMADTALVTMGGQTKKLAWEPNGGVRLAEAAAPAPPKGPDFSQIPQTAGVDVLPPLVGDVDGDGKNEVVHWHQGKVRVYRYQADRGFVEIYSCPSDGQPALSDLDGDGALEIVTGFVSPTTDPVVRVVKPGNGGRILWEVTLKRPHRSGLPFGNRIYFQTGRFTGRKTDDIYALATTPIVRSMMLDGRNGALLWEKGECDGIERYYAPTRGHAAVWDVNGDGKEDLVFTNPDYYCVASGPSGEPLIGPAFPPKIFNQPSQGLYTLPAILPNDKGDPTVCLVDGHYFIGVMTAKAKPKWYRLPVVGECHAGAEGFLQTQDGRWLMGIPRQDGKFVCVDVETGNPRWEYPLEATADDVSACDIDGDGRQEFLVGTSHGDLFALADEGDNPRVVWRAQFPTGVRSPVIADVDGDGASEILVAMGDGSLCLLRAGA